MAKNTQTILCMAIFHLLNLELIFYSDSTPNGVCRLNANQERGFFPW